MPGIDHPSSGKKIDAFATLMRGGCETNGQKQMVSDGAFDLQKKKNWAGPLREEIADEGNKTWAPKGEPLPGEPLNFSQDLQYERRSKGGERDGGTRAEKQDGKKGGKLKGWGISSRQRKKKKTIKKAVKRQKGRAKGGKFTEYRPR